MSCTAIGQEFILNLFLLVLVWDSIARNLSTLVSTWWEDEAVVNALDAFRRVGSFIAYM